MNDFCDFNLPRDALYTTSKFYIKFLALTVVFNENT